MSMRCDVKVGDRFGMLTVLRRGENLGNYVAWVCRCDCGNEKLIRGQALVRHATRSCGCLRKQNGKKNKTIICGCRHPLYKKWVNMKSRCYNPNVHDYENYGARGITVCDEWKNNPNAFIFWGLCNGWKDGLQIDRIDNNKGYSPDNCRFVAIQENLKNKRHPSRHGERRQIVGGDRG